MTQEFSVGYLVNTLRTGKSTRRLWALGELRKLGEAARVALPVLSEILLSHDETVSRSSVVHTMIEVGGKDAVAPLLSALQEESVAPIAVSALVELDPSAEILEAIVSAWGRARAGTRPLILPGDLVVLMRKHRRRLSVSTLASLATLEDCEYDEFVGFDENKEVCETRRANFSKVRAEARREIERR